MREKRIAVMMIMMQNGWKTFILMCNIMNKICKKYKQKIKSERTFN